MSNIKDWSTDPNQNDSAPPLGAPENATFIADGNDIDRQVMADVRAQFEDQGWFNWGHVATNLSGTQFSIPGDVTAVYQVGRNLRIEDAVTLYDTVAAATFVNPNTQVTVTTGGLTAAMNGQTVSTGIPATATPSNVYDQDEIDTLLSNKMDLVSPAVDDNAMVMDANGQAVDAGVPLATIVQDTVTAAAGAWGSSIDLVIPHGLGVKPQFFGITAVIKTAQFGYSIDDEVMMSTGHSGANQRRGIGLLPDTANITLIAGNSGAGTAPIALPDKTGAGHNVWDSADVELRIDLFAVTGVIAIP